MNELQKGSHKSWERNSVLEGVKDNLQKLLNRWNLTFAPALLKQAEEIGKEDIPNTSECNLNGMLCCVYYIL